MKIPKKISPNIIVCLIIPLCFLGIAFAKYNDLAVVDALYEAKEFYFESDLLDDGDDRLVYNYQTGLDTISLEVKNNADQLRYSEVNISYQVSITDIEGNPVTNKSGSTVNAITGNLSCDSGIDIDTVTFSNLPGGSYLVTARAISPYTKELTAVFNLTALNENVDLIVTDTPDSPVFQVTINTNDYSGDITLEWPYGCCPDSTEPRFRDLNCGFDGGYQTFSMPAHGEYTVTFYKTTPATQYSIDSGFFVYTGTTIPENYGEIPEHVYVLLEGNTLHFRNYDYSSAEKQNNTYYGDFYNVAADENGAQPWREDSDSITCASIDTVIKPLRADGWFSGLENLTQIQNLYKLNTSNVTNMSTMFYNCSSLGNLNLSSFRTDNVTDMNLMFFFNTNMSSLNLSNFRTNNVTNMSGMFYYCSGLETLNISSFDTSNVTSMNYMFYGCSNLRNINLSNFNTSNVENMNAMFAACSLIETLDLSSFNTSRVTDIGLMFMLCTNLRTIYVNTFDTSNVTSAEKYANLFMNCTNLRGGDGTTYSYTNSSNIEYARVDNLPDEPGFFTYKSN